MSVRKEQLAENVTVFCADNRDVLPVLGRFDAVVMDPPYGLGDLWQGGAAASQSRWKLADGGAGCRWDSEAPDLSLALACGGHQIVWGGHLFGLPPARGWLVWNKIIRNWSSGECELAWTNLDQPIRAFDCSHGQLATEGKVHPTQKPLGLMLWCLAQLPRKANSVCDPFMGSGSTGVACVREGKSFVGIEAEPRYFDIACRRISDELRRPRLFAEPVAKPVQEALL